MISTLKWLANPLATARGMEALRLDEAIKECHSWELETGRTMEVVDASLYFSWWYWLVRPFFWWLSWRTSQEMLNRGTEVIIFMVIDEVLYSQRFTDDE